MTTTTPFRVCCNFNSIQLHRTRSQIRGWALATALAVTAIGCVDTVGFDPAMDFDTETGDEHPTTSADGVTLEPPEETGDGDGDGDSDDGDSGDSDSGDGDMSDTGETGDAGFCGDGIVDPDEECDMDIAKFGPCVEQARRRTLLGKNKHQVRTRHQDQAQGLTDARVAATAHCWHVGPGHVLLMESNMAFKRK